MKKKVQLVLVAIWGFLHPPMLYAQGKAPTPSEQTVLESSGFINEHPDIMYRLSGMHDLQNGNAERAFNRFRLAARYADKPSQAMVASMYWEGKGVAQNRPLAYAWMDLAAERHYPEFIAQREQYWAQLTAAEQQHALTEGKAVYAHYGDEVTLPRMERELRQQRLRRVGSRTGYAGGAVKVHLPVPSSGPADADSPSITVDGSRFYASKFWEPKEYRAWQDAQWGVERTGQVHVSELERARAEEEKAKRKAEAEQETKDD